MRHTGHYISNGTAKDEPIMFPNPLFRDRTHAGEELAKVVIDQITADSLGAMSPLVYTLPRGGLPVAEPIARRLACPLSVIVAKKITQPDNPELALGAVTADGYVIWSNRRPSKFWERHSILRDAQEKAYSQWQEFAAYCPPNSVKDNLIIVVDDGIATGMTMVAAIKALRSQQPGAIWICVPLAPVELVNSLQRLCDRLIILATPEVFLSVSRFYQEFDQVETTRAIACLQRQTEWLS